MYIYLNLCDGSIFNVSCLGAASFVSQIILQILGKYLPHHNDHMLQYGILLQGQNSEVLIIFHF